MPTSCKRWRPKCHGIRAAVAALSLLSAGMAVAQDKGTLYLPAGMDDAKVQEGVAERTQGQPLGELQILHLHKQCKTPAEAKRQARAIEAGVSRLPALVLEDAQGPYAVIPLRDLTDGNLAAARELAHAPDRHEKHLERLFNAHIFLLCARTALCDAAHEAEIEAAIHECRAVMDNARSTDKHRQVLGLYCLYPLLMKQYAHAYTGAHTPYTEAKLLEAIAALEAARDLDKESPEGKKAHEERERLRMARRKSRQYE